MKTILIVLEAYGERLNGPTLIHEVMQIDLDHSPNRNSSGSQRDKGDPCGGGEHDGLPSYTWSVLEPSTVNSPGMGKSLCYDIQLGSKDCVQ